MRFLIFVFLFFNFSFSFQAQTVTAKIITEKGVVLKKQANIIVYKQVDNKSIPIGFLTTEKGNFNYKLPENINAVITVSAFGYQKDSIFLPSSKKDSLYRIQFLLIKQKTEHLKEVVIVSNKKITAKKDTVVYNVKSFLTGDEHKIEDVIKKLPGIQVDENSGEITFQGKSIQTVLLDGDNLFDHQYTIGTKHINVEAVDKVEAITNYQANDLLKNVTNENNTVLNLKLKKNIHDLSGDIDLGLGKNVDKYSADLSATQLLISKKNKSFSVETFNNIGKDQTPQDFFRIKADAFRNETKYEKLPELFAETGRLFNMLNNDYFIENRQVAMNHNGIIKISPQLNLKSKIYFSTDSIYYNIIKKEVFAGDNPLEYLNNQSNYNNRKDFQIDLSLQYKPSIHKTLNYTFSYFLNNQNNTVFITDQKEKFLNKCMTIDYSNFKQSFEYTKRNNAQSVWQFYLYQSYQNKENDFKVISSDATNLIQNLNNKLYTYQAKINWFGKTQNNWLHNVSSGFLFDNYDIVNEDNTSTSYWLKDYFLHYKLSKNKTKWHLNFGFQPNFIVQDFEAEQTYTDKAFFPVFLLKIKYDINYTSSLKLSIINDFSTPTFRYLTPFSIYYDYNFITKNQISLDLQEMQIISLKYVLSDPYKIFFFNTGFTYKISAGNYIPVIELFEDYKKYTYFQDLSNNTQMQFVSSIEKYFPALRTTTKFLVSIISFDNHYYFQEEKRNSQGVSQFFKLFLYSNYHKINVSNMIELVNTNYKGLTNNLTSLNNKWALVYKPYDKLFFKIENIFFIPDFDADNNLSLYNFTAKYEINKKVNLSLTAQNIFGQDNFLQLSNFDLGYKQTISEIKQSYWLLRFNYDF